jgi:tetratricopeptide (TPR) repeat protein
MEAFEDAVKLAARLNHPNIVRVYSLEHGADGSTAVVMEYVAGLTLEAYRSENPSLEVQQACRIVREAADGILAAHRLSLLHGSLQPARIIISSDGTAKVTGFHRSGLRDDDYSSIPAPSGLLYLAPERIGIIRDVPVPDYRADVYSLGAILYELLTGRLPYEARSLQELSAAMDAGPPLPASFTNPQVSPTLSRVILKSLSRHPGDRHKSVEEFVRELEAARQPIREPERASPESRPEPPRYPGAQEDSGLFPPPSRPGKQTTEDIWPQAKAEGEGSFFGWFKTRAGTLTGSRGSERRRGGADDSFLPRRAASRIGEESEERTVMVSSPRSGGRRRSVLDTFTGFGRNADLTGTDTLPRRRLSSKVYLLLGLGGLALIAGIVVLFVIFGGQASGKLTLESSPPGAQVYLNDEYRGNTPLLIPEIKADEYRLRLQLDGYEALEASVEVGPKGDVQRSFVLTRQTQPLAGLPPPFSVSPPLVSSAPPVGLEAKVHFERMFGEALRARNFFPPASGNAWETLQAWRQREAAAPTAALEQAQQSFCRELETLGLEKLDQRDFQSARNLLDQIRTRLPGQSCAGGLQARYDSAISRSLSDLRSSLNAAMGRQSYVTPESDNALKYARLILHIDPQDAEAKTLENDIYGRALDQARAKSGARDHQEALNIFLQLKNNYPNPPGGSDALTQGIERERQKLSLLTMLKVPYSVQVKHGHSFFRLANRECTGILRADGFSIQYQSTGDHSFKVTYDQLKSVSFGKGKIVLESGSISGGKIELEQADKNPSPSLAEVFGKIEEYRKLREQYLRP